MRITSLAALSPFGPIFGKELRTTARRKRTYLLRLLYLGSLMLFLLLAYSTTTRVGMYGGMGVAARQQQQAQLGQVFFAMFAMFGVFAMGLIGPILTSTAIGSERLARTLNVLLMTPITSWQIVSGKLLSRLWIALTLLGLSLPVLALVRLLGSVELDQMFAVICLCVITALVTAAIGLFYSTLINRAYAVILLAYGTEFVLYALGPMLVGMLLVRNIGPRRAPFLFDLFAASNPFAQTAMMITPGGPFMQRPYQWLWCVGLQMALAALLVFWSAAILRRRSRRDGGRAQAQDASPPPRPVPAGMHDPVGVVPPALPGAPAAPARKPRRSRTVWNNPVLWREVRRPLTARRWQARIGSFICVGLLLLTYVAIAAANSDRLGDPENQTGFAVVFCGMMTLLTCVLSATAIAQEKESDTWTLLLTTPLPAHAIVLGKLLGVMRRLFWPMLLIVGHFMVFTLAGVLSPTTVVVVLWTIITFNSIWLATGLYLSLRLKKVTFAVILNLLLPMLAYIMVPVVLVIMQELLLDHSSHLYEWGMIYLPYPYFDAAIEGLTRHRSSVWLPVQGQVSSDEFLAAVTLVGTGLLLASALMICGLILRFNRIVKRASQDPGEQTRPVLAPPTPAV